MKRTSSMLAIAMACCISSFALQAANWITTASGTYSWTDPDNWLNGTVPTSSSAAVVGNSQQGGYVEEGGHQTITGDGAASYLDVTTAYPIKTSAVRTFAGDVTTGYGIFRSGTNEISGTLTLTGASSASANCTIIGTSAEKSVICGELDIMSGGVVEAQAQHAIYIGRYPGGGRAFSPSTPGTSKSVSVSCPLWSPPSCTAPSRQASLPRSATLSAPSCFPSGPIFPVSR